MLTHLEMGAILTVAEKLNDPLLVWKFQETFGVRVVSERYEITTNDSVAANGAIRRLATKAVSKHRRKGRNPLGLQHQTEEVVETWPLFDIYFKLATELGYEPFYITAIPFLFWNFDSLIVRHAVLLWGMSMYLGQAAKCIFKIPRPSCPPAVRIQLNPNVEREYGFPSTHATVCTTIPFYLVYLCSWRYEVPLAVVIFVALLWCVSVSLSRVYLGVHSFLDIITGFTIAIVMLVLIIPLLPILDRFILDAAYFPATGFLLIVLLLYIYPVDKKWTTDRGDTAAILGSTFGVMCGFTCHGAFPDDIDVGPFVVQFPSLNAIGLSFLRFVVGIMLLLPTRFVMKLLCFRLLPAMMPTHGIQEVAHRPLVEIPYKIITYSAIGFNTIYTAALVFEICGISRWVQ